MESALGTQGLFRLYLKTFVAPFLPARLTAPGSPRMRPHVSGDFCIRKFFMRIQKYLRPHEAYTNRVRPSTRIRFVSGHLKRISQQSIRIKTGSDTVTSAYKKIYGYKRPHVSGYTAYTEISTLESVYRNLRIHQAYTADTFGR